jgi:hypothetical protein
MQERVKLTDWVNEPTITDLKQNLDDAASDQDKHIQDINRWLSNLYVEGPAKPPKIEGQSSVAPKLIRKQAEWRYAPLSEPFLNTEDLFNVHPKTAGDKNRAKQNALVLNNQFNTQIDKVAFIDAYVRDAVDLGTVIAETGWITEEEEVTRQEPVYEFTPSMDPALIEQYVQLLQLRKINRDAYEDHMNLGLDQALKIFASTGQVVVPQQVGVETIVQMEEVKNCPTVEVSVQENLIIDPSCNGDLKKANFIGKKFKSSLSELKKDGRYKNLDHINIEAASPLASPDYVENKDNESFNFTDKARKQFVVHCYWGTWDINGKGIAQPIVACWVNDTMIRCDKNPFPDRKHPFIKATYMPVRGSVYGEPDGELLEDNQKIIGAVTRGMIDLLGKSANGQTGFKRGLLDATNKRKFRRGEDYEFNTAEDPRQGIYQHQYPEIPASAYNLVSLQNTEAESISGVKAYHTGITGAALGSNVSNGRSALDAASKRETGILRRLAAGITEIGRKIISMNAEFLSEEEIIRITNEEFITVRRDDLGGRFDLTLTISTAEEDNRKAEELAFMLQTTGPNGDPGEVRMIRAEIARLRKMPDLAKRIEEYRPEPDPMQVAEQELKIKLLEAQIAKEQALAAKHLSTADLDDIKGAREISQADLNMAKKGTEQAKARELGSTADRKDLDYLEQEAGVHQARDLEQIQTKALYDKLNQKEKTTTKEK